MGAGLMKVFGAGQLANEGARRGARRERRRRGAADEGEGRRGMHREMLEGQKAGSSVEMVELGAAERP